MPTGNKCGQTPETLPFGVRRVVHELRLSEHVFRDYGRQHESKASEASETRAATERMIKAKRNYERADACKAALDAYEAARPQHPDTPEHPWAAYGFSRPTPNTSEQSDTIANALEAGRTHAVEWHRFLIKCNDVQDDGERKRVKDDIALIKRAQALVAAPVPTDAGKRECSVCKAIVASYPEGMCCHCEEMPWPITPTQETGR